MEQKLSIETFGDDRFEIKLPGQLQNRRVIVDGESLAVADGSNVFVIPLADIRAVRCERRLGSITAIDFVLPDGALRAFRNDDASLLQQLTHELTRRMKLSAPLPPIAETPETHIARTDGSTRRQRVAWGVITFVMLTGLVAFCYMLVFPAWQSRHWPSVTGHVLDSHSEEREGSRRGEVRFKSTIRYSYAVNGNTFECDRVQFGTEDGREVARDVAVKHPRGSNIEVVYNPATPAQATIVRGVASWMWVIVIPAALLIVGGVSIALERSTSAQDAIIRKFKAPAGKLRTLRPPALVSWTMPPALFEHAHCRARREAIVASLRLTLISVAAVAITVYLARPIAPDVPWLLIGSACLAIPLMMCALLAIPAFVRGRPAQYEVNREGILRVSGDASRGVRWANCCSYELERVSEQPTLRYLKLHSQAGISHPFALPDDDRMDRIIDLVKLHLLDGPPPREYQAMTQTDVLFALVLTGLLTVAGSHLLARYGPWINRADAHHWVMLAMMVFGPGTISMLFTPRRARGQKYALGLVLNLAAFIGTMLMLAAMTLGGAE